jgi:glyceraldehyde 3-phosphate dehydrogenase
MPIRVAVNGFGRIGRSVARVGFGRPDIEIVAINDCSDTQTLGHLLKYDSVHGPLRRPMEVQKDALIVDGKIIRAFRESDPSRLPWKALEIDIVVESTGRFTRRSDAEKHRTAGAKKVIISAPATEPDVTLVMGVNAQSYDPARHHLVSNASCTTNCLAPVAKTVMQHFGIRRGFVTTLHAYTNDQMLLDAPHKDLRRARSAALSMVPTTTGAARAIADVLPELAGKLDGMAIRVPVPNVAMIDLVVELESDATEEQVRTALSDAARQEMAGILEYTEDPIVSIDVNGNPHSAVVDGTLTRVMDRRLLKIIAWYDNEWGYASRVNDLIRYMGHRQLG